MRPPEPKGEKQEPGAIQRISKSTQRSEFHYSPIEQRSPIPNSSPTPPSYLVTPTSFSQSITQHSPIIDLVCPRKTNIWCFCHGLDYCY